MWLHKVHNYVSMVRSDHPLHVGLIFYETKGGKCRWLGAADNRVVLSECVKLFWFRRDYWLLWCYTVGSGKCQQLSEDMLRPSAMRKPSLYTIKLHVTKTYGAVEINIHASLNSVPHHGNSSDQISVSLSARKETSMCLAQENNWAVWRMNCDGEFHESNNENIYVRKILTPLMGLSHYSLWSEVLFS